MYRILFALLVVASFIAPVAASADTLNYGPAVVTLGGTLVFESHYGPPNFGETPKQDAKWEVPMLKLDTPISVASDPNNILNATSFSDVKKLQMVGLPNASLGKSRHIVVTGTLFEKETGEHYTDVLIGVQSIQTK